MAHRAELLNDPRRRTRHLPREVRDWKIPIIKCQKHTSLAEKGRSSRLNLRSSGNNGDFIGSHNLEARPT